MEIFSGAVRGNTYAIALVHNHPSGNSDPSDVDKVMTKKIQSAGKLLDIPVLDHIIIGLGSYTSFAVENIL